MKLSTDFEGLPEPSASRWMEQSSDEAITQLNRQRRVVQLLTSELHLQKDRLHSYESDVLLAIDREIRLADEKAAEIERLREAHRPPVKMSADEPVVVPMPDDIALDLNFSAEDAATEVPCPDLKAGDVQF
jgi:hypothetical protein